MSELRTRIAEAFGGHCSVPEGGSRSAAVEIRASSEIFEKVMGHWARLEPAKLPRLRGITVSREAKPSVQLLIEVGAGHPIVLFSVAWAGRGDFPSLRGLWPYSAWWERELSIFDTVKISAPMQEGGGIEWQHA